MLFKKSKEKQLGKVHNSLEELSIWHWNKANITGDLKHITIEGEPSTDLLNEAWVMLNNEHLERYGISDTYQKILKKKTQLCKEQIKFIQTNDRVLLNAINLTKKELERLEEGVSDGNLDKSIAIISKENGFLINPKELSVVAYHSHIDLIKEKHERQD